MVSKLLLAESALNKVNGGKIDRDSKITLRQAMYEVGSARNYFIQQDINENYKHPEIGAFDVPFDVLSEFYVTSREDTKKNIWYIQLPVAVISLYRGMGVYHVSVAGDEANDLIPMQSGALSMYNGLLANNLEGQSGYIPQGQRLELVGICEATEFLLRLIVDSKDLADRGDFKLSADMQQPVVDMAVRNLSMQAGLPQDMILNNSPEGKVA